MARRRDPRKHPVILLRENRRMSHTASYVWSASRLQSFEHPVGHRSATPRQRCRSIKTDRHLLSLLETMLYVALVSKDLTAKSFIAATLVLALGCGSHLLAPPDTAKDYLAYVAFESPD